jgi:hypothetical protein
VAFNIGEQMHSIVSRFWSNSRFFATNLLPSPYFSPSVIAQLHLAFSSTDISDDHVIIIPC